MTRRCAWCGRFLRAAPAGARYCSAAHQRRGYARQFRGTMGLSIATWYWRKRNPDKPRRVP